MTIDKSWTTLRMRSCPEFFEGLDAFLEMCKAHLNSYGNCRCPCDNHVFAPLSRIRAHIHRYGFSSSYTNWRFHGEPFVPPAAKANLDEKTDESVAENHHTMVELSKKEIMKSVLGECRGVGRRVSLQKLANACTHRLR